uniref:Nucleolar complex protein 2 homolog n=1 Tax=Caenorhabditis japonica TaxID=281687 RepID=A0A8R1HIY7_CAEJA
MKLAKKSSLSSVALKKRKLVSKKKKAEPQPESDGSSDDEVPKLDGEGSLDGHQTDEEEDDGTVVVEKGGAKKHKLDLEKLKLSDPEFFKFLQQEDADLLNMDDDGEEDDDDEDDVDDEEEEEDEDDDEDDDDEDEDDKTKIRKIKKPKTKSDSSGRLIVDSGVYSYLQEVLALDDESATPINPSDVRMAVDVFVACVARVGADIEAPKYVINEQSIFEAVVRLCFQAMPTALQRLLNAKKDGDKLLFSKMAIKKYQTYVKAYLHALLVFLNEVQTTEVVISTLKAITRIVDFYAHFTRMSKLLIKAIVKVWSRKTLECRLPAFVCMNLLVKSYPQHFAPLYKVAYVAFVANSKVVSNETWPLLQFMHRTFAELTILNPEQAYKYAFVYIRQTAVHLRNAMIAKGRKDLIFSIYNWQMMQCMYLWVRVIAKAHAVNGAENIGELVYPLIQVIVGIFRLCNAPTFLPLRLHCCQLLIQLQASCTNYIPILQLSCDCFEELARELKSKPKPAKGVVKLPDIECVLKCSSQYVDTPQWRKLVCEHVFRTMMQSAHLLASQAAFADVLLPINHRISSILETIKNGDHAHLFRGFQTKLKEHSKFVLDVLAKKHVDLNDEMQVRAVRFELNNPDSPIKTFYRQWEKVWKMKEKSALENSKKDQKKKKQDDEKTKKRKTPSEDVVEDDEDEDVKPEISKAKRKRIKIGAAAKKADATVPDRFADIANWSDED